MQDTPPPNTYRDELDTLKVIYEGHLTNMRASSERSFTSTLQALTLNLAVLAGLIAGKVSLLLSAKLIGTSALIIFNVLVVFYLVSKGRSYAKLKKDLALVENALIGKSESLKGLVKKPAPTSRSFWGGTGIFCLAVLMSAASSTIALWVQLVPAAITDPAALTANSAAQGTLRDKPAQRP